jgi:large subunit ribosomal protein L29
MKIKEFKTMNQAQLAKLLAQLREQVRDLRFKIHSKEVKNPHILTKTRRDIARILTLLKQRENS